MLSFRWLIPLSVCCVPLYPRGQRVFSHPSCSWLLPSPYSSFKTFVLQRRCRGRIWAWLQSFLMVAALPLSQSVPAGTFSRYSHQSFLWVPSEVSGEESEWISVISVAPGFYTVPLAHTWPLPINLLIILAESLLFFGVQLHQPKVRKYSHPISACNHLSSLDLVSFSWLASWLTSNVSSLKFTESCECASLAFCCWKSGALFTFLYPIYKWKVWVIILWSTPSFPKGSSQWCSWEYLSGTQPNIRSISLLLILEPSFLEGRKKG